GFRKGGLIGANFRETLLLRSSLRGGGFSETGRPAPAVGWQARGHGLIGYHLDWPAEDGPRGSGAATLGAVLPATASPGERQAPAPARAGSGRGGRGPLRLPLLLPGRRRRPAAPAQQPRRPVADPGANHRRQGRRTAALRAGAKARRSGGGG